MFPFVSPYLHKVLVYLPPWNQERQANTLQQEIGRGMREMAAGVPRSSDMRKGTSGKVAVYARWVEGLWRKSEAVSRGYDSKMAALHLEEAIAPKAFASQETMHETRLRLECARHLIISFREDMTRLCNEAQEGVARLTLSEAEKREALEGCREGLAKMRPLIEKSFRAALALVDAYLSLHQLIRDNFGHYQVSEQRILFESPEALRRAEALRSKILSLATEVASCQKAVFATVEEESLRLESMAK
jgi:hypothetical protein